MSPESRCIKCKEVFLSDDERELQIEEVKHYRKSKTTVVVGDIVKKAVVESHDCRGFQLFNDDGELIGCRTYAHGKLYEEILLTGTDLVS
jgi:hypothetical protein